MSWNKTLTGAINTTAGGVVTSFAALTAKSILANAAGNSAVPIALAGSAAFQHLRVNSANNALEWAVLSTGDFPNNSVPVTALATIATDTFLANITAGTATPTAVSFTSVDSTSLIWDAATHTFQRAAMTGEVTSSQNSNATVVVRSTDFAWTGIHSFAGSSFIVDSTGTAQLIGTADVTVASSTGGVWIGAGHTPVVSPSVSNGDVLINASNGAGVFARAIPATNVGLSTVEVGADGDIVLNAGSGIAIVAGSGAVGFPVIAVTTGNLVMLADGAANITTESGNIAVTSGADVNISAIGGVFIPSPLETGNIKMTGSVGKTNVFSSTMGGNLDNLAIGAVSIVRLNVNGGTDRQLAGMVPEFDGQIVHIVNTNDASTGRLVITNGTSGTAANGFLSPGTNHSVRPRGGVTAWYDGASDRWRILVDDEGPDI